MVASKPKPKFKKGDKVVWVGHPEYNYKPGTIARIKTHNKWWPPIYKVVGLGPFEYYWLDEEDVKIVE